MPWKETNVDEEKIKFIAEYKNGGWSMTDLCKEFGIDRSTGYKYIRRFNEQGLEGLKEQSRAPKNQPNAVREKLVELILEARDKKPGWGPEKLLCSLEARYPSIEDWPSITTVGRILKKNGRIKKKKRRRTKNTTVYPLSHVIEPNDVWCTDFKGYFTVGNGKRCDPLTIADAYSRYLLACKITSKTNTENVQDVFTEVFREYGLPEAIRSDNGSPFAATRALGGLSRLSVWWMKLGIRLERIRPGNPQENGRHERMHLTLKQETALPPRSSLKSQQKAFDAFIQEYNYERPHGGLKNRFPGEFYKPSKREFPEKIPEMAYPTSYEVERVSDEGNIRYGIHRVFIASALRGELIGLEEISDRHRRIHFSNATLGVLDIFTGRVLQYPNPKPSNEK